MKWLLRWVTETYLENFQAEIALQLIVKSIEISIMLIRSLEGTSKLSSFENRAKARIN